MLQSARDDPSQLPDAVAALDCRGNFMFDAASHRDFLGAILGTGVVREKVGVSCKATRVCNRRHLVAYYISKQRVNMKDGDI
jgi:hypothetical protein